MCAKTGVPLLNEVLVRESSFVSTLATYNKNFLRLSFGGHLLRFIFEIVLLVKKHEIQQDLWEF